MSDADSAVVCVDADCPEVAVAVTVTVRVLPDPFRVTVLVVLKLSDEAVLSAPAPAPPVDWLDPSGRRVPKMPPALVLSTQSRMTLPTSLVIGIAMQLVPLGQDMRLNEPSGRHLATLPLMHAA